MDLKGKKGEFYSSISGTDSNFNGEFNFDDAFDSTGTVIPWESYIFNDDTNLPKEAFDKVYIPNGYVDIVKATYVMNNPEIHGDSMIGFVSPVCSEVDSIEEFDYIQYQINRDGTELQNYLNSF